jgi:hypothetical protein
MKFNPNNKNTWWFVSDENMMLSHNILVKDAQLDMMGVHDCVEQTYHAYVTYEYEPFIEGIKSCWKKVEYENPIMKKLFGYKYKPQRYPISYPYMQGMSRDHVIYSLMAFIHYGMSKIELYEYVKRLPFMIGDRFGMTMTPELWLWGRLISGKLIGQLFYPLILIEMIYYYYSNKLIDKIADFGLYKEDHPSEYKVWLSIDKPEKYNYWSKVMFPTYALKLAANMTSVLPNNWFIRQVRKIVLKMTPNYNYVIRMLFKGEILEDEIEDINNYNPLYHERWSAMLNRKTNNRQSYRIIEKQNWEGILSENVLEKDYAIKLFEK